MSVKDHHGYTVQLQASLLVSSGESSSVMIYLVYRVDGGQNELGLTRIVEELIKVCVHVEFVFF